MQTIPYNRALFTFDRNAIAHDFQIYSIRIQGIEREQFGQKINQIYQAANLLSLAQGEGSKSYYILLKKGEKLLLEDDHFAISQVDIKRGIEELYLARLLIGALPILTHYKGQSCNKMGLHYLSKVEVLGSGSAEHTVLRMFRVALDRSTLAPNDLLINIVGTTFTSIHHHMIDGALLKKYRFLPQFEFNELSQKVKRVAKGRFINVKSNFERMTSDVLTLDPTDYAAFEASKIGTLCHFMKSVEEYLSKYLTLTFDRLTPAHHQRFTDRCINEQYKSIEEIMKREPINFIDLTEDKRGATLLKALKEDHYTIEQSDAPREGMINLALHHNREYYRNGDTVDPYPSLHQKGLITQSVTAESLLNRQGSIKKALYEAVIKELFIKLELKERRLLLPSLAPKGEWHYIWREERREEESEIINYHRLIVKEGEFTYQMLDPLLFLEDPLYASILLEKRQNHLVINRESGQYFIIEESNLSALPEYEKIGTIMDECRRGQARGILRVWIEEYLDYLNSGELLPIDTPFSHILNNILEQTANPIISSESLFNGTYGSNFPYRGESRAFLDWIHKEKGVRLKASFRSQKNPLLDGALGIFYNGEEQLYFAGLSSNAKPPYNNFARMRKIISNAPIDERFLNQLNSFYIRHKQSTVYPYLFKYLREEIARNRE